MRWQVWLLHLLLCVVLGTAVDIGARVLGQRGMMEAVRWMDWLSVLVGMYGLFLGGILWGALYVHGRRLVAGALARLRTPR